MKLHPKLLGIYAKIPEFTCKPNCSDCCGIVPWAKIEWDEVKDKRKQAGFDCPYVGADHRCEAYEQRPFLCRIFGASMDQRLVCPHGCRPLLPLEVFQTRALFGEYMRLREEMESPCATRITDKEQSMRRNRRIGTKASGLRGHSFLVGELGQPGASFCFQGRTL